MPEVTKNHWFKHGFGGLLRAKKTANAVHAIHLEEARKNALKAQSFWHQIYIIQGENFDK